MASIPAMGKPQSTTEPATATGLHSGDRMDQATFHALYEATPRGFKAELIEGTVYVASPVSDDHSALHANVMLWAGTYRLHTPGTILNDNGTVILGPQSEPQPDAALRVEPSRGGRTRRVGKYIVGPPELAIEVAYSSRAIDLHAKSEVYRDAGIQEYLVVVAFETGVTWFGLRGDRYEAISPGPDGVLRSAVFPGLWLDPAALTRGDLTRMMDTLQAGLATPEHAAFVARLAAAGPR